MREAIRALERESVLDKIKAEIEQKAYPIVSGENKIERGMTLPRYYKLLTGLKMNNVWSRLSEISNYKILRKGE